MAETNATAQLDEILNTAVKAAGSIAKLKISFESHAPLVTHAFLIRQIELGHSIRLLINHGLYPGAAMIARTMLEGASALHWVLVTGLEGNEDIREQEKRAGRWRGFAWVEDKQFIEDQRALGLRVDPEKKRQVEKGYAKYLRTFEKAPTRFESGWRLDDLGGRVKVMAYLQDELPEDIKEEPYKIYKRLSSYVHWSPGAFNLRFYDEKWHVDHLSSNKIEQILRLASISLAITTYLVVLYFELPLLSDVERFMQNFGTG